MILVDINVSLRIDQVGHPHRKPALDALRLLTLRDQERFAVAPQNLYEMYVVCTRPASVNGFGFSSQRACAEIAAARTLFEVLPETVQVYSTWEGLVAKYAIQGKQAHDVRLCRSDGLTHPHGAEQSIMALSARLESDVSLLMPRERRPQQDCHLICRVS